MVSRYVPGGLEFEFSAQPEFDIGNLLRWQVTLPPDEEVDISYLYRAAS